MLEEQGRGKEEIGPNHTSFDAGVQVGLPGKPSIPLPMVQEKQDEIVSRWNTANLGLRFGADASSAATASALVAPLICVIDR